MISEHSQGVETPNNGQETEKQSNNFEQNVALLAGQLHDEWRAPRLLADGRYEPRVKGTKDSVWIGAHQGQTQLDIANTPYTELPSDWQKENKESAEVSLREVYEIAFYGQGQYGGRDFLSFDHFVEWVSAEVHKEWLYRNQAWAPPEQNLPYDQLSEEEKDKDRAIVRNKAAQLVKQEMNEGRFKVPESILLDWIKKDSDYLKELTDKDAFEKKRAAGETAAGVTHESIQKLLNGWKVETLDYESLGDYRVHFHLEIPSDGIFIEGIYELDSVAKFLKIMRNNTPDITDSLYHRYEDNRLKAQKILIPKGELELT
jgi:hypothetical protein